MNKEEFAKFVRTRRRKAGLIQSEFADLIGVSLMTVWRWENEENIPAENIIDMWINKIKIIL